MADTLLKVDNINVYYGKIHALKDVSFEVHEGEVVALIGATRGWLPETIDRWNAARPGRGVGGGRTRKHPEE